MYPQHGHRNHLVESVTNAMKYAFDENQGGRLAITLTSDPQGGSTLRVEDDGVGFDARDTAIAKGLGSKLMQAFSRQLGATLDIQSAPGEGSVITLSMPPGKKPPA